MAKSPYTDLPEPLKSHLPALFASYPELSEPNPSSWFVWSGDKVLDRISQVCHAHMVSDGTGWDEMITAVPKNDELSLEYLRMLIRGPFRSLSDLIKLDRVVNNYFLHLLSLNRWPANVLMNFCIASRAPIEFAFFLSPWAKRCEAGFDPVLAWLLTYSYGSTYEKGQYTERSFKIAFPGHMWIDPSSNWSNILYGQFVNMSPPFKTCPQKARPTNIIWGRSEDYKKLLQMSDEEIAAFYTQPIQVVPPPPPVFKKKAYPFPLNVGLVNPLHLQAFQQAVQANHPQPPQWVLNIPDELQQPQLDEPVHEFEHEDDDDFDLG